MNLPQLRENISTIHRIFRTTLHSTIKLKKRLWEQFLMIRKKCKRHLKSCHILTVNVILLNITFLHSKKNLSTMVSFRFLLQKNHTRSRGRLRGRTTKPFRPYTLREMSSLPHTPSLLQATIASPSFLRAKCIILPKMLSSRQTSWEQYSRSPACCLLPAPP